MKWNGFGYVRMLIPALLAVAATAGRAEGAGDEPRPNVLFIFSDQHRMASFPGEPHTSVLAPHLERLAREGAAWENAISNYPVCSPFRAMLISGRVPFRTGVTDNSLPLPDNGRSIAQVFSAAGWRTGYIGKWHLGGRNDADLKPHGFAEFEIWRGTNNHRRSDYRAAGADSYTAYEGYNATGMTDHATEFIRRHADERFFLMLSLNPPHSDFFDAPEEYQKLYATMKLKERPNVLAEPGPGYDRWSRDKTLDATHRGYLSHVTAMDHEIGRLLDLLDELDLSGRTIVIYTSDHGEMMGSHGRMGKRDPYEESIRIPFVVRWPGVIRGGSRIPNPVGVIDFAPTLCGLAGADVPREFDGHNLAPLMLESEGAGEGNFLPPAFQPLMHIAKANATDGENHPSSIFRGVRTERHTYAVDEKGKPWLLFDNEADPWQMNNMIGDPAAAKIRAELHERTRRWLRDWDDPFAL